MSQTKQTRTLDDYLALPYTIALVRDEDDEGNAGYVAEVEELPGCLSQGATPEDAIRNIFDAMEGWLSVALEDGKAIPEPRAGKNYSGRFLLRIPQTLHAELAREAEREGVSLNQYAAITLARGVGRREKEYASPSFGVARTAEGAAKAAGLDEDAPLRDRAGM
jgi:predicted RNase H-like HicB family nuclease